MEQIFINISKGLIVFYHSHDHEKGSSNKGLWQQHEINIFQLLQLEGQMKV
jgi:hypothetical protein